MSTATTLQQGAREYARLLLKLHELDPRGEVESEQLDSICDQMDLPWLRLTGHERRRVKGLSEDLYALADGRQAINMSPEDRQRWFKKAAEALTPLSYGGEVDPVLESAQTVSRQCAPVHHPLPSGYVLGAPQ